MSDPSESPPPAPALIKIVSDRPTNFRLTYDPATEKYVLQGGYYWSQGTNGGFEWNDLPTIIVS